MRHRKNTSTARFGKAKGHRELMIRNLLTTLFSHEKLKTTEAKAKIARSSAEKLITRIKNKDQMNAVREAKKVLFTNLASKKALEIADRFKNVSSGFTRLTGLGDRAGDAARIALIEFIESKK